MRATPFREGFRRFGRWLVSWLTGLPAAPSRLTRGHPVALSAAGVPDHSGGSALDSHRLLITTDRRTGGMLSRALAVGSVVVMTVNLTRIYTRLGDGGETHLAT